MLSHNLLFGIIFQFSYAISFEYPTAIVKLLCKSKEKFSFCGEKIASENVAGRPF